MSNYTELLEIKAETLSPDEDGYELQLLENAKVFRGFDEAFTAFLVKHGFEGDPTNAEQKSIFLKEKYRAAGIKLPQKGFKEWFTPNIWRKRESVIPICFAFELDLAELYDFFRSVQFDRSLDCHTRNEAVYYYCIKNKLKYSDAEDIIARLPKVHKMSKLPDHNVLYTGTIIEYIDSIDDNDELIRFISENIHDFEYNNATAIMFIRELWKEIAKSNGLAVQEGWLIDRAKNNLHSQSAEEKRAKFFSGKADENKHVNEAFQDEELVIAKDGASTWTIFSQIIGLDNKNEQMYANKFGRSLESVLCNNALLPFSASFCFPSRQNIDKLIRGEIGNNEMIRKMLIFLVFYTYWARKIIRSGNYYYNVRIADSVGCMDTINKYLLDAGYPQLYAGNPYDWIFMWALNDSENPLEAFRSYMNEVITTKDDLAYWTE